MAPKIIILISKLGSVQNKLISCKDEYLKLIISDISFGVAGTAQGNSSSVLF
jgi:hypothetical protein